jgi:hypothetical protein
MVTTTDLTVIYVPTPLLALAAAVGLAVTAVCWLFWFLFFRESHKKKPAAPPTTLAWELVDGSPAGQPELFISDKALELRGSDYRFLGNMPANFLCSFCNTPEDISLKLYLHVPSHTMVVITRHGCRKFIEERDTTLVPIVGGPHV